MRAKEIIVLALVIIAVVAVFAFGIVDFDTVWGKVRAIFYRAPAILQGPQPGDLKQASQCRDNIKAIESAKRKYAEDRGLTAGAQITWADVIKTAGWREAPKCPSGGTYNLGPVGSLPTCSIGDNNTLNTDDDHNVRHY